MAVRTVLIGVIEIDDSFGVSPLFESRRMRYCVNAMAREECAKTTTCDFQFADLYRLRQELACEFLRLQARLAA